MKSASSVNSFKHYIKEYFLKKLGNVEADIYSYTQVDTKMNFATFLEFMQNRISITVCYYHVTYAFQSESTLYSCLNVKELLARSRREI